MWIENGLPEGESKVQAGPMEMQVLWAAPTFLLQSKQHLVSWVFQKCLKSTNTTTVGYKFLSGHVSITSYFYSSVNCHVYCQNYRNNTPAI